MALLANHNSLHTVAASLNAELQAGSCILFSEYAPMDSSNRSMTPFGDVSIKNASDVRTNVTVNEETLLSIDLA